MQWVIKIGGSLYDSENLIQCLDAIQACGKQNIIIVPGGGPFADQVRNADQKFKLKPSYAHCMAVLGMQQFGYLLASLKTDFKLVSTKEQIEDFWEQSKILIWEPLHLVQTFCELEKSWQVTSDSLAAWFAHYLSIKDIIYIKSDAEVLSDPSLDSLASNGCIDNELPQLIKGYGLSSKFLHKSQYKNLESIIRS